jgi:hypothetical protein
LLLEVLVPQKGSVMKINKSGVKAGEILWGD